MPYDTRTYGQSPFGAPASAKRSDSQEEAPTANPSEALSDELATPSAPSLGASSPSAPSLGASSKTDSPPPLPTGYVPAAKARPPRLALLYLPKGGLTGMPIAGEAALWLMAWGTVGFFRSYIPPAALSACDRLFSPWGMAALTFLSALSLGRRFHHYALKLAATRDMATTAIEYGEAHHQADTQNNIYDLLSAAQADTERLSGQAVSTLTALAALFIIGAFY